MDHRRLPTLEALQSTRRGNWIWGFYRNRHGVQGVWILIPFAGQFHKISFPNCRQLPEQDELIEMIRKIKMLDSDRTWVNETQSRIPGFSTTAWSNAPFQGSTSHAIMEHAIDHRPSQADDPAGDIPGRPWFFIKHDELFNWYKKRHGAAPGWVQRHKAGKAEWSEKGLGVELRKFLQPVHASHHRASHKG